MVLPSGSTDISGDSGFIGEEEDGTRKLAMIKREPILLLIAQYAVIEEELVVVGGCAIWC